MIEWYDLNARHEAAFLWAVVFLVYIFARSPAERESSRRMLKIFLQRTVLMSVIGLFFTVTVLATVAVVFGRTVGLWETLPVVTVLVWAVTSGIWLLLNISDFLEERGQFIRKAKAVLVPATIVAAFANIATLLFWWEVVLIPPLVIFGFTFAYYESKSHGRPLYYLAYVVLVSYTVVLISLAIKNLIEDPTTWKSVAQAALLPTWLTIGTLPYLYFLMRTEQWTFSFRCPSKTIRSTDYGSDWPLVVDSAKLCWQARCCLGRGEWKEVWS